MPRKKPALTAPMPARARAASFEVDGVEHLVLSFPVMDASLPCELTDAERSVAHLLLAGLSNEDIAHARRRSPSTVAKQVGAVFRKLGVTSRAELAARVNDRSR